MQDIDKPFSLEKMAEAHKRIWEEQGYNKRLSDLIDKFGDDAYFHAFGGGFAEGVFYAIGNIVKMDNTEPKE